MNRPMVAMMLVAITVAAAVGVAEAVPPPAGAAAPAAGGRVPVVAAELACPQAGLAAPLGRTTLVASALGPAALPAAPGSLRLAAVPASPRLSSVPLPTPAVGRLAAADVSAPAGHGVALRAAGAPAAGLAAAQLTLVPGGPYRGLAAAACVAPATSWWFVGPSGALDTFDELVVTNVDPVPAVVDVTVLGTGGPLADPAAQGVSVPAGGRLAVPLAQLAPGVAATALHVVATSGRVAAAVLDARAAAGTPQGLDWIPASTPPAGSVVVPGLTPAAAERTLVLANPAAQATTVAVHVLTAGGSFVPAGLQRLSVPAGTVRTVELSQLAAAGVLAVRLSSSGAVLAAVRLTTGVPGATTELAWSAGTAALGGPVALAVPAFGRGAQASLALAAAGGAATVRVVGPTGARVVPVPADGTAELELPAGTAATLAVLPGSGPVTAALVFAGRPAGPARLLSVLPVTAALRTLRVPPVRPDLGVAQGG